MNFMFPSCLGYVHFEVENGDDNKENQDHSGSNSNPHAGTATILALRWKTIDSVIFQRRQNFTFFYN